MVSAIGLFLLPILALYWLRRGIASDMSSLPGATLRDLWTLEGSIDRGPYLAIGFSLMTLKYNLERLAAGLLYHRSWSVLAHYLHAPQFDTVAWTGAEAHFYAFMTAMSLPFIWTGVALTVRRLRSAGLPPALVALFFVPFLNLLFFLVLAALPAAMGEAAKPSPFFDRLIPRSKTGAAVGAALFGGLLVLIMTQFSSALLRGYGWGLFIGLPFVLGLTSALVYGHHQARTLSECLGVSLLTACFGGVVLFAAAVEGVICLAMAAPLAVALAGMGAVVGYFIQNRPPPMIESSWYPDLHPAHLDDYLVSKGGEFRLEPLPSGGTRLIGTTWYSHAIRPGWYWRPMSDWIIHRIHERVLAHIKTLSEERA